MSDLFLSLTPDRILSAAEIGGWRATGRVLQLNSLENRVYEVELERGDSVILKFYRPARWSREQILEEHAFLSELAAADVPVVAPSDLGSGATLHEREGIFFAGFTKGRGRTPDELDSEQLRWIGRLLARLHLVGQSRPAPFRLVLDATAYSSEDLAMVLDRWVPLSLRSRYLAAAERLRPEMEARLAGLDRLRIHGDCHLGNLLWSPAGPFFLDFDDFATGPAVQDVWMVVPGRDEEARVHREVLLEGYETLRAFDRRSLAAIEALRALRILRYAAWIARRWHDPAFPRAFPDFDEERFWQAEVRALEEISNLLHAG